MLSLQRKALTVHYCNLASQSPLTSPCSGVQLKTHSICRVQKGGFRSERANCLQLTCNSTAPLPGSSSVAVSFFFPSNAFMASARSSNTFNCMLQTRVNWLINAYMAACRLRGFKSDLVKDLYIVQSVTKSSKTKNNSKNQNGKNPHNQNKTQQPKTKKPNRGVTGASSWAN